MYLRGLHSSRHTGNKKVKCVVRHLVTRAVEYSKVGNKAQESKWSLGRGALDGGPNDVREHTLQKTVGHAFQAEREA